MVAFACEPRGVWRVDALAVRVPSHLVFERLERCRICGGAMRTVHDIFHCAMLRAVEQGGSVEVVHGDAERRLYEFGGIGALLRRPFPLSRAA